MARRDEINARFERIINDIWPAIEIADSASTYTLYRRQGGGDTDLGERIAPWTQVAAGLKCVFAGTKTDQQAWGISMTGQGKDEIIDFFTGYDDIQEGDNVKLDLDGKMYLVEKSNPYGGLRHCWLNSARAQHVDP